MRVLPYVVACAAAMLLAPAIAVAGQPEAIPQPVEPGPFTVDGLCAFPVTIGFSGKVGRLSLPDGRVLNTSPGLTGTYTNAADPSRSITLNITGTAERDPSGLTVFRGRSVLATPDGLLLIVGTFTATPADGLDIIESGQGTRTPVCPLIS